MLSTIIVACLIDIIDVPPVMPVPVIYGDSGFTNNYHLGNAEPDIHTGVNNRQLRMIEPSGVSRNANEYPWIRRILAFAGIWCYVLSVRASLLRNKLLFITMGVILSYGSMLF